MRSRRYLYLSLLLWLTLVLTACPADPGSAGGPADPSVPAFLLGAWREQQPPGISPYVGSRMDIEFARDSALITFHNWSDMVICDAGDPPRCSSSGGDHVYAAAVHATDSALSFDWVFRHTTARNGTPDRLPEAGRSIFRMTISDTSLALEEAGGDALPVRKAKRVFVRPKP